MTTLEGLIGKIPSNPLWAELLALKMRERHAKRVVSSQSLAKDSAGRRVSTAGGKRVASRSSKAAGGK
jgi:serine/arginine repetitive matrix protein 2